MQIDKEDLEEFKRIYAIEFGEELPQAEAGEIAGRFVDLYMLLAKPLPSELEAIQKAMPPSGQKECHPSSAE